MITIEIKTFIKPQRDTDNSFPSEIEFTSTPDGRVTIELENRALTFDLSDFKAVVRLTEAAMDESE